MQAYLYAVTVPLRHACSKIRIHVHIMPETVAYLCQLTSLMVSCLLLVPWCTAITGYWICSNKSNSQQQPTAGYRQTSKSL